METDKFLSDESLKTVLRAAEETRTHCMHMLDWLEHNRSDAPSEELQLELSKQQKLLGTRLARLRGLNRKAIFDTRATKQHTAEAKSEIDTLHLQLQNLYYEQRHLIGEIAACESYEYVSALFFSPSSFLCIV